MSNTAPKKEWKWPLGIFIAYMIFVAGTLGFVAKAFMTETQLVVENYYEKTLTFDRQIEETVRARELAQPLRWQQTEKTVRFEFPEELLSQGISGEIYFFRPSDSGLDRRFSIQVDEKGIQHIPLSLLSGGLWKIKAQWISDDLAYYKEENLFIRM